MYPELPILLGLVFLSAFFSGSETALVSVSNSKVDELVAKKLSNAKLLKKLKKNPHKILITVLIGNNVVNVLASAYAAIIFTDLFGSSGIGIATGVMTFLLLVFGEITPKSFAHQHAARVALFVSKPIYLLQLILFPVIWFFDKIVSLINYLSGSHKDITVTEGELVAMLNIGAAEGSIEKQEKEFIENVLEFNDIEVGEIMTPRVAIEAMESKLTIQEAVDFAIKHSHTRIPVYDETVDNIIGIISIKELLRYFDEHSPNKKIKSLKLPMPLTVPLSKKIDKLFREFQRKHLHMAIVIDEFGGTAGLVTLEDLLEEIVGEIVDEFDVPETPIETIDSKNIIATGKTLVEDVNDFFRMKFGKNDHETLNEMITDYLHRFPREGEIIDMPRAKVTILKIKKHVVDKVKITKKDKKSKV